MPAPPACSGGASPRPDPPCGDHVLNLATTNYPEQLDRRFVARPRRFDRVVRIDAADERTRRSYLVTKLPGADAAELERWVHATEGLSLAALAEAVISVRCLGNAFEETIALLRRMSTRRASIREFAAGAGFAAPRGAWAQIGRAHG